MKYQTSHITEYLKEGRICSSSLKEPPSPIQTVNSSRDTLQSCCNYSNMLFSLRSASLLLPYTLQLTFAAPVIPLTSSAPLDQRATWCPSLLPGPYPFVQDFPGLKPSTGSVTVNIFTKNILEDDDDTTFLDSFPVPRASLGNTRLFEAPGWFYNFHLVTFENLRLFVHRLQEDSAANRPCDDYFREW